MLKPFKEHTLYMFLFSLETVSLFFLIEFYISMIYIGSLDSYKLSTVERSSVSTGQANPFEECNSTKRITHLYCV